MPRHSVTAVILAAGRGKRMQSDVPKVLHRLAGMTLLGRVAAVLRQIGIQDVAVVLGSDLEPFAEFLGEHPEMMVCRQPQALGTGHAVGCAAGLFAGAPVPSNMPAGEVVRGRAQTRPYILIVNGDAPAMNPVTLGSFVDEVVAAAAKLAVIGIDLPDPSGYGRLVLDDGRRLLRVVEERDTDVETRKVSLCNSGVVMAKSEWLFSLLGGLSTRNSQAEYYLTDCFAASRERGSGALVHVAEDWQGFLGVNTVEQLRQLEEWVVRSTRA